MSEHKIMFFLKVDWDSVFGLVTRLWAGRNRNYGSISGGGNGLISSSKRPVRREPKGWLPNYSPLNQNVKKTDFV
jgi:hypothetical protein